MATEQVQIGIVTNTQESQKSIKDLKKEVNSLKDSLVGVDTTSKQYKDTLAQISTAQSQINKINNDVRASTMNLTQTLQTSTTALKGVVAGFTAVKAAGALLGTENEALAETFVKLQAGMALIQSLTALTGGLKAANTAFKALNATVKVSPLFLLVGTITAIVGAFKLFTSSTNDAKVGVVDLSTEIKNLTDNYAALEKQNARNVNRLRAAGADAETILNRQISNAEKELTRLREDYERMTTGILASASVGTEERLKLETDLSNKEEELRILKLTRITNNNKKIEAEDAASAAKRIKYLQDITNAAERESDKLLNLTIDSINENTSAYEEGLMKRVKADKDAADAEVEAYLQYQELVNPEGKTEQELFDEQLARWQAEIDVLGELAFAEDESWTTRADALKRYQDAKKAVDKYNKAQEKEDERQRQASLKATEAYFNASAQLLGESTAAGKALAVAGATINTYTAAAQVLANPTELNPYAKWAQFAATIVLGLANVKNILSTKIPGVSDNTSGDTNDTTMLPNFPETNNPIQETHSNIDAYEEDLINNTRPVLVVEDYNSVAGRVQVAESESSF